MELYQEALQKLGLIIDKSGRYGHYITINGRKVYRWVKQDQAQKKVEAMIRHIKNEGSQYKAVDDLLQAFYQKTQIFGEVRNKDILVSRLRDLAEIVETAIERKDTIYNLIDEIYFKDQILEMENTLLKLSRKIKGVTYHPITLMRTLTDARSHVSKIKIPYVKARDCIEVKKSWLEKVVNKLSDWTVPHYKPVYSY